jgi:hypothetical protein
LGIRKKSPWPGFAAKSRGVKVVITEMTRGEIDAHMREEAEKAAGQIQSAINNARRHSIASTETLASVEEQVTGIAADAGEYASQRLKDWLKRSDVEIVDAGGYVDADELTRRYLNVEPPFDSTVDKKNEFPDAIALLSLEGWAEDYETKVLGVSTDKGWLAYHGESEFVLVTDDLAAALAAFQTPTAATASRTLFASLSAGDPLGLEGMIRDALNRQAAVDFEIDADSQFGVTVIDAEPEYREIEFPDGEPGSEKFEPVGQTDDGEAVVRVTATVNVKLACYLRFSKWDAADKEAMPMGEATIVEDEEVEFEALVTLGGDIPETMGIEKIEIVPQVVDVKLFDVEPDWMSNRDRPSRHQR